MDSKINLKFILASDPNLPFKTISVPEATPFLVCIKHAAGLFNQNPATCAVITNNGVGINPDQTAGQFSLFATVSILEIIYVLSMPLLFVARNFMIC